MNERLKIKRGTGEITDFNPPKAETVSPVGRINSITVKSCLPCKKVEQAIQRLSVESLKQ